MWRAPLGPIQIVVGFWGPFLLSLFLFLLLLLRLGKGGNLLLLGVGIPLGAHHEGSAGPLLPYVIYGGGGTR